MLNDEKQEKIELAEQQLKKIINKVKKIRRNDPCHCGSGKKYKKCCLTKDAAMEDDSARQEYVKPGEVPGYIFEKFWVL
ncbi:MAG: hypothetical protein B6I19_05090 [Bacteroidetes bacterium 4572_114]|nr:MAG: hypothetical protein B6I19_05090 [Bacteroidetes bacterium 4572_114]